MILFEEKIRKEEDEKILKKLDEKINNLLEGAPEALDTLKELADAIADDPNFASNILNKISNVKSELESFISETKDFNKKIEADLKSETETRVQEDLKLQKIIEEESKRAQDEEKDLDTKIFNEIARATKAELELDAKIDDEIERSKTEYAILKDEISKEVTRAKKAEGSLRFNDDVRNEDGTLAKDLTNAINIVDNKANKNYIELKDKNVELKSYIDQKIENLINGAPEALDTLKELAEALSKDENLTTTISEKLAKTEAKVGDLTKLTTDVKIDLVQAINEVQSEVNNEAKVRVAADNTLNDKILTEAARAKKAEGTLLFIDFLKINNKIPKTLTEAINNLAQKTEDINDKINTIGDIGNTTINNMVNTMIDKDLIKNNVKSIFN